VGHKVSVATAPLCYCSTKQPQTVHTGMSVAGFQPNYGKVHKRMSVAGSQPNYGDLGLNFVFHVLPHTLLLIIFQPFKNMANLLSSKARPN